VFKHGWNKPSKENYSDDWGNLQNTEGDSRMLNQSINQSVSQSTNCNTVGSWDASNLMREMMEEWQPYWHAETHSVGLFACQNSDTEDVNDRLILSLRGLNTKITKSVDLKYINQLTNDPNWPSNWPTLTLRNIHFRLLLVLTSPRYQWSSHILVVAISFYLFSANVYCLVSMFQDKYRRQCGQDTTLRYTTTSTNTTFYK